MNKRVMAGLCAAALLVCAPNPFAQEREDRTLLSHEQMRAIINDPLPLADVTYLRAREQAGLIRLVTR